MYKRANIEIPTFANIDLLDYVKTAQTNIPMQQPQNFDTLENEVTAPPVNQKVDNELLSDVTTDESLIDEEVQQIIVTMNDIAKRISVKFYKMEISDIESLKIVKELMKDISNRIAHVPVDDIVDRLDGIIDKAEKGPTEKPTPKPGNLGQGTQNMAPDLV